MKRIIYLVAVFSASVGANIAQEAYEGTTPSSSAARSESLQRTANNVARPVEERSGAIVRLFQEHLQSGFSSGEVSSLLKDASWLDQAKVTACLGVGGKLQVVPSCSNGNQEKTFRVEPFPSKDKTKTCAIEFRVRGIQPDGTPPTPEVVLDFLKGGKVLRPSAAVTELALCFPKADGAPGRRVLHYGQTGPSEYDLSW